uniref:Putative plant transposon protein domain-containing protein n=1 Tax=Gossypium raimondii TaxID=29730 RepID=A0A0D2Q0N8_GOSRA|nr:hypothetical protein B456_006G073100 [Gossypium raimondii]
MEEVLRFLTKRKEVWTHQTGIEIPETLSQALMTLREKLWMKFVRLRIWPVADLSDISPIQAILVHTILQRKQICIGTWIYRNIIECVRNQAKGTFFPHLITELCKRARIPIERLDKKMNPPKKLVGDDLYKQFVIL